MSTNNSTLPPNNENDTTNKLMLQIESIGLDTTHTNVIATEPNIVTLDDAHSVMCRAKIMAVVV